MTGFVTYRHSRSGKTVTVRDSYSVGGDWVPVVDDVVEAVEPVVDPVVVAPVKPISAPVDPVVKVKKDDVIAGLEWLGDDNYEEEINLPVVESVTVDYNSYKELQKKGDRVEGAVAVVASSAGPISYYYDGKSWRRA